MALANNLTFNTFDPTGWMNASTTGRRNNKTFKQGGVTVDFGGTGYSRDPSTGEKNWGDVGIGGSSNTSYSLGGSPVYRLGDLGNAASHYEGVKQTDPILGDYVTQANAEPIWRSLGGGGSAFSNLWETLGPGLFAGGLMAAGPLAGAMGASGAADVAGGFGDAALTGGTGADALSGAFDLTGGLPATDFSIGTGAGAAPGASGTIPGLGVGAGTGGGPTGGSWFDSLINGVKSGSGGSTFGLPNNVLSAIVQGGLGAAGAGKQADAYNNVASQNAAIGAPFRNALASTYSPNFNLWDQPGYAGAFDRAADISARTVSANRGNPYGNPTAMAEIQGGLMNQSYLPALSNFRGQLGQFGGLGLNTSGAAQLANAQNAGGEYDALGVAAGRLLNPQPSIEDLFRKYGILGDGKKWVIAGVPKGVE